MQPDQGPASWRVPGGSRPARPVPESAATTTSPKRGRNPVPTGHRTIHVRPHPPGSARAPVPQPLAVLRDDVGLCPARQYRCRKRDSPPMSRRPSVKAGSASRSRGGAPGRHVHHPVVGDDEQYGRRAATRTGLAARTCRWRPALSATATTRCPADDRCSPTGSRTRTPTTSYLHGSGEPGRVQPVLRWCPRHGGHFPETPRPSDPTSLEAWPCSRCAWATPGSGERDRRSCRCGCQRLRVDRSRPRTGAFSKGAGLRHDRGVADDAVGRQAATRSQGW